LYSLLTVAEPVAEGLVEILDGLIEDFNLLLLRKGASQM
jgi:hypothetical protein